MTLLIGPGGVRYAADRTSTAIPELIPELIPDRVADAALDRIHGHV